LSQEAGEVNIELNRGQIETLFQACDCAAVAMEDKLLDEDYMLDFIKCRLQVNRRLDQFRPRFLQLNCRLNVLFAAKS
jgi:hypothetical protein